MSSPRIEIDLKKIAHNTKFLVDLFRSKGIGVMGVTKGVLGDPSVANVMVQAGVDIIGDSRIENIRRMHQAGVKARFALIRSPLMSQIDEVIQYADVSMNSELCVLRRLSQVACEKEKTHRVILMIELGDLREGIPLGELEATIEETTKLPGIELAGIGTNLGCIGGVIPTKEKMDQLCELAESIERKFGLDLEIVSGGNSANFSWFTQNIDTGRINNLRIGEMIFLGHNTLDYAPVEGLYSDAVTLVAEVIEFKIKESVPFGAISFNAFGQVPSFSDRGQIGRAILGLGRQDVLTSGLTPIEKVEILGSSSDHIVVDTKELSIKVGDELRIRVTYGALLAAMTSPYIEKMYFLPIDRGDADAKNSS